MSNNAPIPAMGDDNKTPVDENPYKVNPGSYTEPTSSSTSYGYSNAQGVPSYAGQSSYNQSPAKFKETWVAYLLWFFLYWTGAHRFYLGDVKRGLIWVALTVISMISYSVFYLKTMSLLPNLEVASDEAALMNIISNNMDVVMPSFLFYCFVAFAIFIYWVVEAFILAGAVRRKNESMLR